MARSRSSSPRGRRSRGRGREHSARKAARYLEGVKDIDPNDWDLLRKFLSDHGKIIPSRLTGTTAKQQRQIKHAVRQARVMGLLP